VASNDIDENEQKGGPTYLHGLVSGWLASRRKALLCGDDDFVDLGCWSSLNECSTSLPCDVRRRVGRESGGTAVFPRIRMRVKEELTEREISLLPMRNSNSRNSLRKN